MGEVEAFLAETMPRFHEAETALHNGDASLRMAMWSHDEPVTLFGAALEGRGWPELKRIFEHLGERFSNCTSYENEVIAAGASGDLGYVVAREHTTASVDGAEPRPYELRVTTVFRREGGEWRVVHRHADPLASEAAAEQLLRLVSAQK